MELPPQAELSDRVRGFLAEGGLYPVLGTSGPVFHVLKSIGVVSEEFTVLKTPLAVVAGITYNYMPFAALPL